MLFDKATRSALSLLLFIAYVGVSCLSPPPVTSVDDKSDLKKEIELVDTLLRDINFAEFMARSLDSAYYTGLAQTQPPFLIAGDSSSVQWMRAKDEKIAISIAPFYALECGVELLCKNSSGTFISWLEKIARGEAGSDAVLLLNRFANATWKAGQPFRDLQRIKRYNFRVSGLLSKEEVDKDSIQIVNAAKKLLPLMQPVANGSQEAQMKMLRTILQDTTMAAAISYYADSTYAVSQKQVPPPLDALLNDTSMLSKNVRQIKIATSIAGFYALECGLNYLVTTRQQLPSKILHDLVSDSLKKDDMMIFARFANATWKAGQPFRGLSRISRATFTPFFFLSGADIDKDLVQVKAAGKLLLARMKVDMK